MITRAHFRVAEAMIALAIAKVLIRVLPFERLRALTGAPVSAAPEPIPPRAREPLPAAVGAAIRQGSRRLPWYSSCLVRAVAGRMMLLRRGVPSTLVFGVQKAPEGIRAHAWLVAGGGTVCGGKDAPNFRHIASFGRSRG